MARACEFSSRVDLDTDPSGNLGFNLDFELADGEDLESWVVRLREFLKQANAPRHGVRGVPLWLAAGHGVAAR
jgi:hypothetical protein